MALCGIPRIDGLAAGGNVPIGRNDADREAVGVVQDFLIGHGYNRLPDIRDRLHGTYGPRTEEAVRAFQQSFGLSMTGSVDRSTLSRMVDVRAASPIACRGYLTMVLDEKFGGMTRVMSVTTQFEGAGKFSAINRNTDGAGLSFGLIQWAQKPLRLNELLRAFDADKHDLFVTIFGGGSVQTASGLLQHTSRPSGGLDPSGATIDQGFNLIQEPWISRFRASAAEREFQKTQVKCALAAFRKSLNQMQTYAPELRSERAISFVLDLANQHGDGGARQIYQKVRGLQPGASIPNVLLAMQQESVEIVRRKFTGPNAEDIINATNDRRHAFRTTTLLSDEVFDPN